MKPVDPNDIARAHGHDHLRGMFDRAERGNGRAAMPRFALKPFNALLLSTAPNYLVKGIIPRGGLAVVWGPPKCGKSFWTFDLTMHVALGWPYRGRRVQQGAVVYLALEGGGGFCNRIEAWRRRHPDLPGAVPFYLVDVPVDLIADRDKLIEAIRAQQVAPTILVVDTLHRGLSGDENKSEDMAKFIRAADTIRAAFGCSVIVVHHCGVQGGRPRGHTSLPGADDAQIAVERTEAGAVIATVEHMKDGEAGAVITSRLDRVDLGIDDDGDPITSCVVVPAEGEDVTARARKIPDKAKIALDLLDRAISDAGEPPPASNHIPAVTKSVVTVDLWRRYCLEGTVTESDKRNSRNVAFNRVQERLQALGLIGVWNGYVWPVTSGDKR